MFYFQLLALQLIQACERNLSWTNSLATDNWSAIRRLHQIISMSPYFSHIFMVLFGFCGLQLWIEAIISKNKRIFEIMEKTSGSCCSIDPLKITACSSLKAPNSLLLKDKKIDNCIIYILEYAIWCRSIIFSIKKVIATILFRWTCCFEEMKAYVDQSHFF